MTPCLPLENASLDAFSLYFAEPYLSELCETDEAKILLLL